MITLSIDGDASSDATAEQVAAAVDRLGKDADFLVLERDDAPGFAQATGGAPELTVEHKDAAGELWQATTSDRAVAAQVLTGWAQDLPGWRELLTWSSLGTF